MLLKQIKYFIAIVECRNFTEAAEQCYISQSAISQQIHSLETELWYKLLIREKRTFTLTPAGKCKFYHDILNFKSNFIFAENLEEANLLVASNKGFLPIETSKRQIKSESSMIYIPLYFKGSQLSRKYYAFWKKDNSNEIIEAFANILNKMF